jgi:CSLREA domain-containing protein
MPNTHRPTALFLAALAVCAGLAFSRAPAAPQAAAAPASVSFTVTSTLDAPDLHPGNGTCETDPGIVPGGACTLRAAIMEANLATNGGGATVIIPAGIYPLTIPGGGGDGPEKGDLNLTAGAPVISLTGAGAASTIIDANQNDRVLSVAANRAASVSGLTLRGGYVADQFGGGLYNSGTLTVTNSIISGNQAARLTVNVAGGGAVNLGTLTLIQSTVVSNSASYSGGGLYNAGVLLLVDRSTLNGNLATYGGGVFSSGPLTMESSTLSGNDARKDGGALYSEGVTNIYNTTIAFNLADADQNLTGAAGGIYAYATVNLRNSLVAGNGTGSLSVQDDCFGNLQIFGLNIIGEGGAAPRMISTIVDATYESLNSLATIGPLQNNGGPTATHALLAGSNAIDGGDPVAGCVDENSVLLPTDQRGAVRTLGAACDLGAFEFLPPAAYLPLMRR